jgi:hypothetical protein
MKFFSLKKVLTHGEGICLNKRHNHGKLTSKEDSIKQTSTFVIVYRERIGKGIAI